MIPTKPVGSAWNPTSPLIRKLPHCAGLPIIAMTAAAMESDRQECLAAGMNAHVAKPIDAERLVKTLLEWVSVRGIARPGP